MRWDLADVYLSLVTLMELTGFVHIDHSRSFDTMSFETPIQAQLPNKHNIHALSVNTFRILILAFVSTSSVQYTMAPTSHSNPSLGTSLISSDRSVLVQESISSNHSLAKASLITNKEQMDLRKSVVENSKKWKGLYYAPTSFQKLSDLESERRTLERKLMDDMSHLTEAYNYNIASIRSISAKIPKYPKDVPRQLVEYLSEQDDVPTFEDAITSTGSGGAFVELNWVLKQVKLGRESETDQGTCAADDTEPVPDNCSVAVVWEGEDDSEIGLRPYQPRRVSYGAEDRFDCLPDPTELDNYEQ